MTEREALKLALEALEDNVIGRSGRMPKTHEAITAIREALAQQNVRNEIDRGAKTLRETYLAQPAVSETHKQSTTCGEPVGWVDDGGTVFWKDKPPADGADLYTTPPQRTWFELTAQEIADMAENVYGAAHHDDISFGTALQAKLKEKNCD